MSLHLVERALASWDASSSTKRRAQVPLLCHFLPRCAGTLQRTWESPPAWTVGSSSNELQEEGEEEKEEEEDFYVTVFTLNVSLAAMSSFAKIPAPKTGNSYDVSLLQYKRNKHNKLREHPLK
eukprot:4280111-Pyramimonas_sp.AAC.2